MKYVILSVLAHFLWRPKYFTQNSETSDSDSQLSRLACVGISCFRKFKLKKIGQNHELGKVLKSVKFLSSNKNRIQLLEFE